MWIFKTYLITQNHYFYQKGEITVSFAEINKRSKKEKKDLSVSIHDEKSQSVLQYCEKPGGTPRKLSNYDLGVREKQNFPCLKFQRKRRKKAVESQICALQETPILFFCSILYYMQE